MRPWIWPNSAPLSSVLPRAVRTLLILLGGGVDKMDEGMEKSDFSAARSSRNTLQRCHSIGIDRQERCLMKEAKDINII